MKTSIVANQLEDVYPDCIENAYTDEELVALAQAGQASARLILCRRYIPLIMRYSHVSQLHSVQHDLEATLWESFLKAIRLYNLNGTVPFAGFAKSKVHYAEMNFYRNHVQQWNHESMLIESEEDVNPILQVPALNNTEQEALQHLQISALYKALTDMNPVYANLLKQILFQGLSISDIAKSYGMTRQAMHKKYKKAITLLRQELKSSK